MTIHAATLDWDRTIASECGVSSGRHRLRVRLNFQATLYLSTPVPDANLSGAKSALLLRVLNGLGLENENTFLARALGAGPSVTMRLDVNDEPGVHVG